MQTSSHAIDSMNLPRQTETESLLSVKYFKRRQQIVLLMVIVMHHYVKQNAVGLVVKRLDHQLQCIGCQPVVSIQEACIVTLGLLQCYITSMSLPLIFFQVNHLEVHVSAGIVIQNCQRPVSRGIVNTNNLNVVQRLCT